MAYRGLVLMPEDIQRSTPLDSWSKYPGAIAPDKVEIAREILRRGNEVEQMMTVVGEEGTSMQDFIVYLKGEFFDRVYLQQNAYHEVDAACSLERQHYVFDKILDILQKDFEFKKKDEARSFFFRLQSLALNWNEAPWQSDDFKKIEAQIKELL